jgi:DNA-binding response OmpR family regulator
VKPGLVLLYTRDRNFDQILAQALSGTDTIVLVGRTVADGLKIVCRRGRELDLVVLDLNPGCRGMTLLSAIHGCYETLPILVVTSKESEPAKAIACANGARICLSKPLPAGLLASVIVDLQSLPGEGCPVSLAAGRPKGEAAARSPYSAIRNFQVRR